MSTLADKSQAGGASGGSTFLRRTAAIMLQFGMIWAFIALVIIGAIIFPHLIAPTNIKNLLGQAAPVGIVAVGMTFVMISGGFDLSVGATFALAAVVFADRYDAFGPIGAALVVIIVTGLCGAVNGFIITRLRVNPFVATLGTGSVFGGSAYIYSHSAPITPAADSFQWLGTAPWLGLPISVWLMLLIYSVGWFALAKTIYGQSVYAIGGNNEAARLSGLRVNLLRGSAYLLTGLCAGVGGMIIASRLAVGQADMGGTIALDAIAIVVIGGTSLLGGEGTMWRTAIGLLIIATLTNIFDSLAVSTNYQLVVKGCIVIGSVSLDLFARSLRV